jgi:putative nucleotidyltransferase with HDIG domain
LKPDQESIRGLFPELDLIKDKDLRRRTAEVWADAIDLGGWEIEELDRIPFTLLIPDVGISLIEHTRAITRTALAIAEQMNVSYGDDLPVDMDILTSGGILHDVGKLLEYVKTDQGFVKSEKGRLLRHPFSGQALAYRHGIPFEVLHTIAYHSKEGDLGKRTTEAIIIHHSDFVNFEPLKS